MEMFEKINRAFGGWYEGLFGGSDDVRPKDILRRIFTAMEENRKEHLDDKVYVPNHYILEIAVDDEEEKEYLRSFLVREELEQALRRYCKQNHYEIRGGLEFTIREVEPEAEERRREKVRVRARYDSKIPAPAAVAAAAPAATATIPQPAPATPEETATVYEVEYGSEESGTVPAVALARLSVTPPDRPAFDFSAAKPAITIGRSARAGNDVVLESDGKVSRRHARIELEQDDRFTIYDLDTTNGTRVNGKRIDNCALKNGDEIQIGDTRVVFRQGGAGRMADEGRRMTVGVDTAAPRLILMDGDRDVERFVLGSETVVGRGATNDIVLDDRSVATRHAVIKHGPPCTLEVLAADHLTLLNGSQLRPGDTPSLKSGDRIGLGTVTLRFEEGQP